MKMLRDCSATLMRLVVAILLSSEAITANAEEQQITVGDAYVRSEAGQTRWIIGTPSIEHVYDCAAGLFRLVSYKNLCAQPAIEYVEPNDSCAPFATDLGGFSGASPIGKKFSAWKFVSAKASEVGSGGRPAVQFDCILTRGDLRACFHVLAFPGTAILRQWVELENTGSQPVTLPAPATTCWRFRADGGPAYTQAWMGGGLAAPHQGKMDQSPVTPPYSRRLAGQGTCELVPWTALYRSEGAKDGWFMASEYLGPWSIAVDRGADGPLAAALSLPELNAVALTPGQRLELPMVTFGVFCGGLDAMGTKLYDWQYEYLWNYTNADYYARSRCAAWWFYCSQNLQEQFTARLAYLDMETADAMRATGYEVLWDDAGWSAFPGDGLPPDNYGSVFRQTYDGPDFALTQRYLKKADMRWILWFVGRPSNGLLDNKIGAWGDFEWRTDGVGFPNLAADQSFRADVKRFLETNPGGSFHTCSGGSNYSHVFEIGGRYSSYNYLSDLGRGPYVNHFFSYLEPPDRWGDMLISIASIYGKKDGSMATMAETLAARGGKMPSPDDLHYVKETARGTLTNVLNVYWRRLPGGDAELARRDAELYRFLHRNGLAGRWCYVFHPAVEGDPELYYFQRTSRDRLKACIILAHCAENPVVVHPQGLLPEAKYLVGFDSNQTTAERTGADLMTNGIAIQDQKPGELIYLNLPHRPGSGADKIAPNAPGRLLTRRETNIGHGGIALYWSPGVDDHWVSYYEVRRDEATLDKVAVGTYFFDRTAGWEQPHVYSVRTVDGDGNASGWTTAEPIGDEPMTFASLGGHFRQAGRDGWTAETTTDPKTFAPMQWVPAAKNPAADFGGTPNQRGGVEGYWEGPGGSRIGRGWQQASPTEACARVWTAPKAGTIHVVGRAMREYYRRAQGGSLGVKILLGDRQVWPEKDWAVVAVGDLNGAAHHLKLDVAAGDSVRFVLDKGTAPGQELIAWMPRITYEEDHAAAVVPATVRILCGAASAYTDRCGNLWAADQHFTGGEAMAGNAAAEKIDAATPTPDDQPLYQHGRSGKDFSYSIPVPTGLYSVRLKFAEPRHPWMFERPINVCCNGQAVLTDFDVVQAAKGWRRAVEKTFHYVVPAADGRIVLHFTTGRSLRGAADDAMVQAIEILPELKTPVRINAGSETEFVDWTSCVWATDAGFSGGAVLRSDAAVAQASPTLHDQALYRTARAGRTFSYSAAVQPGLYTVHLKFAELWLTKPGERPMDITINGRTVKKAWDPAVAAGSVGMAMDLRFDDIPPNKDGRIVVGFSAAGANDAILQAIELE